MRHRAVGLAGIMGGENSEIVDDTADVVFESANFDGTSIRRTALALGMRTEASAKFEKGLDPLNTLPAVKRACELVELLGAGEVVDGVIDILNYVPHPTQLAAAIRRRSTPCWAPTLPAEEMRRILTDLGFGVEGDTITVPSWRGDVDATTLTWRRRWPGSTATTRSPPPLMHGVTTQGGYSAQQVLERNLGVRVCRAMRLRARSSPTPSSAPPITTRFACRRTPPCASP